MRCQQKERSLKKAQFAAAARSEAHLRSLETVSAMVTASGRVAAHSFSSSAGLSASPDENAE